MDLMKHTKAELAELVRTRNTELEALRLALSQAEGTIAALRAKHERPRAQPGETRYWDEFEDHASGLAWAKANPGGCVKQRPAQRAEA